MNPDYKEYRFPQIRPLPWEKVFRHRTPREAIDFVARLLQYDPKARPTPLSSLLDFKTYFLSGFFPVLWTSVPVWN